MGTHARASPPQPLRAPAPPPPNTPPRSIRLPQNKATGSGVVLGEGKPENQNAAIIFCFGEVVQVRGVRVWVGCGL